EMENGLDHPLDASHQSDMIDPSFPTTNTSRCRGLRETTATGAPGGNKPPEVRSFQGCHWLLLNALLRQVVDKLPHWSTAKMSSPSGAFAIAAIRAIGGICLPT